MKRFFKIAGFVLLFILILGGSLTLSLRIPSVQNYLAHAAVSYLSNKLGTKVEIQKFEWNLFRNIDLRGFYLTDRKGDTLIYAGTLNADISYWSLLNRRINIKAITLDDAKIYLQSDTAGNLNLSSVFIREQNASVIKVKPAIDTTARPLNLLIQMQKISLNNTSFKYEDLKKHLMMRISVASCAVDVNKLAIEKKLIDIHSVKIDGVLASVSVENKDESLPTVASEAFRFLPAGWLIRWDEVSLLNSSFTYDDINRPVKHNGIDFAHLLLADINIKGRKGSIVRESMDVDLKSLTAKEKSGFEIRKLAGLAKVSVNEVSLRNLSLQTNNSSLNTYLGFTYADFEDFKDFADKVTIKADLNQASLSLRDLDYFFHGIGPVAHNTITISGKIRGKLNALQGKNITVGIGMSTYLKCNFYTSGLPKLDETSLNLRIEQFSTSATDIRYIYPTTLYPPSFNTLGHITFTGDFDGFVTDFVTRGNLYTDIGSASSDVNFKYNKQTNKSAYSGELSLKEFDLGKWFADPVTYGKVSLHASVEGGGVKIETLHAKLLGDVSSLTLRGYEYKDLKVDGLVKGKFFSGNLVARDTFFDADFSGTVDLTGKLPQYNFAASVRNANLRELHLSKDTVNIKGDITANFSGKKVDDLVGSLILNNIFVQHGHESVTVKNVTATSDILADNQKEITIKSDEIEGDIKGRFSFVQLPKALKSYFNYTFTKNYEDTVAVAPQQFTFNLQFFDSSSITRVIDPRFKEIRNTTLSGELNTENHILNVKGSVPDLIFDKYTVQNFNLDAKSQGGKIDVTAGLDRLYAGDSVLVDTFSSHTYTEGSEFRFDIRGNDARHYNRGELTAYLKPLKSSIELRFLPSEVWLGGNKWNFSDDNRIVVQGKKITTEGLTFSSGNQAIIIDSYLKNDSSTSVNITMSQTSLSDFVNIFSNKVRDIKATVNGTLKVEDIFSHPAPTGDLEFKDFYLGAIPMGTVKVSGALDNIQKKIIINAGLTGDQSDLAIKGFYDLSNGEINLDNQINSVNLNFLNYPLFVKYVRRVSGTATAKLSLHGPLNALILTGGLKINEAKVNISYLNTTYRLKNEDIEVGDGYFDVGTIAVIDSFNNTAVGTGRLYHEHFKKITLDLHVVTNQAQILNTTAKDMPQFYGNGIVKGAIDFSGTIPQVNINADISEVKEGTHCYIPILSSYETSRYSFYRFVNPKKDTIQIKKKEIVRQQTGVNFILKLQMTHEGIVDVVLDPTNGDVLTSRGNGAMQIAILRTGEFNILGEYTIDQGSYLFTMQNIIHKKFDLDQGGTITFKGDVYNAQINANAIYHVKTSTYDLISDLLIANGVTAGQDADLRARNRINVDLLLKIKGVLQTPEISFDIKPIDPDPAVSNYVDNKMQLMKTNEAELNKQVFGLLVMNRFLPSGSAGADASSGRSLGNSATNTVSEFLSSQLSMYTGSFFDNLNVKDLNVNLNFQTYDQLSAMNNAQLAADNINSRREVQLALTKKFFNQRLSVNVGGNLDFGDNYAAATGGSPGSSSVTNSKNTYATGDFQVEYVLDKKGVWRAKTYNRNDYDNFNNRNINKTGIGISFRKEFDNWQDLFKKKAKKPAVQYQSIPAKAEDPPVIRGK